MRKNTHLGIFVKRGSERFFDFLPDNPGESGFSPTAKTAAVQRWTPITTFPPLVQEVKQRGLPASHGNRAGRVRQVSGMRVQTTETTPARSAHREVLFPTGSKHPPAAWSAHACRRFRRLGPLEHQQRNAGAGLRLELLRPRAALVIRDGQAVAIEPVDAKKLPSLLKLPVALLPQQIVICLGCFVASRS